MANRSMLSRLALVLTIPLVLATTSCISSLKTIEHLVWLPDGTIYYQSIDFDGNAELMRRDDDGLVTSIEVGQPSRESVGVDCQRFALYGTSIGPTGSLGLQYRCLEQLEYSYYVEWTSTGFTGLLNVADGWQIAFGRDGAGVVERSRSDGRCVGLEKITNYQLDGPYPTVEWEGQSYDISIPTRPADCDSTQGLQGAQQPATRHDRDDLAFLASPRPDGNHTGGGPWYLWWWPEDEDRPVRIGDALEGVHDIALDPSGDRVAVSLGAAADGGVAIIDLSSGEFRWIVRGNISEAAFSPDGSKIAYIENGEAIMVKGV